MNEDVKKLIYKALDRGDKCISLYLRDGEIFSVYISPATEETEPGLYSFDDDKDIHLTKFEEEGVQEFINRYEKKCSNCDSLKETYNFRTHDNAYCCDKTGKVILLPDRLYGCTDWEEKYNG